MTAIFEIDDRPLTDEERFPLLSEAGRKLLLRLREHRHAPRFNHQCGDRLNLEAVERIRQFEIELRTTPVTWTVGQPPAWVHEFTQFCLETVPFYRTHSAGAAAFHEVGTFSRADLNREPWSFVSDSVPLDDLIYYTTSGTTGHPLKVLSHPEVSGKYLPLLKLALATRGVTLEGGEGKVSIAVVCAQSVTYTYATVSSVLGQAGTIKINLNPGQWNSPDDRQKYLDDLNPEVYSGDPLSFMELTKLPLKTRPKALVSSSMTLLPGWRQELENHFQCPVIDVYSMNECRLMAVAAEQGYVIVPHDLYVEIVDTEGRPCPPGVAGEVTVTCNRNPFLSLLRYRTGDRATLEFHGNTPVIASFEGRKPTLFVSMAGKVVNNIDVSTVLYPFPIAQFHLHQNKDRSLVLKLRGAESEREDIRKSIVKLFGRKQSLEIQDLTDKDTERGKVLQYTSDISDISIIDGVMGYEKMTWPQIMARAWHTS
ncbi:MAG TPA: hypothetical protein V6D17_18125 [Candidatus Obscuribacterales bacterium]